jgi:hypothetical protein
MSMDVTTVSFIILFMSIRDFGLTTVVNYPNVHASLKLFLYLFLINVNWLKDVLQKYIDPKNVKIALTFGKMEGY